VINVLPWAALLVAAMGARLADLLPRRAPWTAVHAGLAVTLVAASVALWLPRDRTVVVHHTLFTDLVNKFGFAQKNVIIVQTPGANAQYPTGLAARDHAVAVAHFGSNDTHGITSYRVGALVAPLNRVAPQHLEH
jgi:hypothetical protein